MKRPDYDSVLVSFSQRLYKLRHDPEQRRENGKKKSFKEISEEIEKMTEKKVCISHTQLAKYYKMSLDPDDEEAFLTPNIKSVLALADYYNVSLEYLLGLSETKSTKDSYKTGSEAFGLSDTSMEILEELNNEPHIFNAPPGEHNFLEYSGSDFINFMFDNLLTDFHYLCNKYLYDVQELEILKKADEAIKIDYLNIKTSLKNMDEVQKGLRRQEDMVKYRAFQIAELVTDFLKKLSKEVLNREIITETDSKTETDQ